jgi:hypothetical protein
MDPIYVEIQTAYSSDARKAPAKYSANARTKMEAAAKQTLKKASDFTTDDKTAHRAAFVVRLKVSEIIVSPASVTVKLTGELLEHPNKMISTSLTSNARVDGDTSDSGVMDAIDAAAEAMMQKTIPVMKQKAAP